MCPAHAANMAYPDVSHSRGAGTLLLQLVHIHALFPVLRVGISTITLGEVCVFTRCVQSSVTFAG